MGEEDKLILKHIDWTSQRQEQVKKFALTLLQQCKGENLSMVELYWVLGFMKEEATIKVALRDGLVL